MTSRSMNRSVIFRALKIRKQRPRLLLDYGALCGVFTKKCARGMWFLLKELGKVIVWPFRKEQIG